DDAWGAYYLEARAGVGKRRTVVLERKLAEQVLQHEPDGKVDHGADHEAAVVQVIPQDERMFFQVLTNGRIVDGSKRHRPRIKPRHSKEHRNEQHYQQ